MLKKIKPGTWHDGCGKSNVKLRGGVETETRTRVQESSLLEQIQRKKKTTATVTPFQVFAIIGVDTCKKKPAASEQFRRDIILSGEFVNAATEPSN